MNITSLNHTKSLYTVDSQDLHSNKIDRHIEDSL